MITVKAPRFVGLCRYSASSFYRSVSIFAMLESINTKAVCLFCGTGIRQRSCPTLCALAGNCRRNRPAGISGIRVPIESMGY